MEISELKAFSDHALAFAKKFLQEHKQFNPMFQVLSASGVDILTPGDLPDDMDEHVAKDALAEVVRSHIRERQALGVVSMSDAWVMKLDECHPFFKEAQSGRFSIQELERMGVGKRREALILSLETPIYARIMEQFYYRNAEGNIIFRELKESDSTSWDEQPSGRFYNFFDKQKAVVT